MRFSLSLQIKHLQSMFLICAPIRGRDDDFLRSHQQIETGDAEGVLNFV